MYKRIKDIFLNIMNSERDIRTKIFILLTIIGITAMVVATIVDIIFHENIVEIVTLIITLVAILAITHYVIVKNKVQLGAVIMASGIIFIVVPIAFFFGGGLTGGGIIWICFAYLYTGLILVGRSRVVMISLLSVFLIIELLVAYYNPQLTYDHDRFMWYLDVGTSVLVVGLAVYFMVLIQYRLYLDENKRTMEQAEKIEKLNRAQNRFFSSMSHEIRTPINTIIGLNEMNLRETVNSEVAENSRNIQAASKILLSLINDILDMSKIESGKMEIVKNQYDVSKMLSDIVNMVWIKAHEKGLQFTISVDPSLPSQLFSDEIRIKQILINILNNAIKYTGKGSVSLSVHCTKTAMGKARVSYSVEDTGMGIKKDNIPYLFDAFRREDTDKNRYIEGTGLGLSIVKQLVDLLEGTVTVNSVYGKGSTFIVTIDQEIADDTIIGDFNIAKLRTENDKSSYLQSFEAPDARVLVVDDNSTNLLVVKKLLKDTKLTIDTVESAKECLEMTLLKEYDLILMDHLMPEMDGIQCLHALREQAGGLCKETPVVALTANAGSENQFIYRREGFDEYLVKPVDAYELERTVRRLLPREKVTVIEDEDESFESDKIVRQMKKKIPILITTDSVSDIPAEVLTAHNIPVMSYNVVVNEGIFSDGIETGSEALIRVVDGGNVYVDSLEPSTSDYERFFSEQLAHAQHIIHISTAKHVSTGYVNACEAALTFYNVKVFDSGQISSGLGLMVLYAKELAESGQYDIDEIIRELEIKREKIQSSFVVEKTERLFKSGYVSGRVNKICDALMLHPSFTTKNSDMKVKRLLVGNHDKIWSKFIKTSLENPGLIDESTLFITYVGLKKAEVEQIKEDVQKIVPFENVYLQKASASISLICGSGTFGLMYSRK